ncbi:iron ABC transporter [Nocardiopsis sp. TSRI0078]|nr:iron ABC transporter [Nocardiopsis sp. TSRI0078]
MLLGAALAAVGLAALCLGRPVIAPAHLPAALTGDTLESVVLTQIRLPRLLLGLLAGAALGAAGLLLQEALRNPLAVPELLGVSAGAAAVVATITVFSLPLAAPLLPAAALAGGVAGGSVCLLAARRARAADSMLLTGAAVSTALTGVVYAVTSMADQFRLGLVLRYLMGSLVGADWDDVALVAPWLGLAAPAVVLCLPLLGVLALGDDGASALGMRPRTARAVVLAVAAALVAVVVAACGPVAWVGFLAPMLARRLAPLAPPASRMACAVLLGATVTVAADLASRTLVHPIELPLGAFTGTVGVVGGLVLLRGRAGEQARGGGR